MSLNRGFSKALILSIVEYWNRKAKVKYENNQGRMEKFLLLRE
jgi:hypothetical protein